MAQRGHQPKPESDPPNLGVTALHDTAPVTIGGSVKKHLIFTKSENSKKFRGRVNVINSALYHATTKWILIQYRLKLKIVLSRESCRAPNVIVCQAPNLTIFRQAPKFQLSEECLLSG